MQEVRREHCHARRLTVEDMDFAIGFGELPMCWDAWRYCFRICDLFLRDVTFVILHCQ